MSCSYLLNKMLKKIIIIAIILLPIGLFAETVQPVYDPGTTGIVGNLCADGVNCKFEDLITLVKRILGFIVFVSIPLAAIAFAYSGFLILTAGPNASQAQQGKKIFTNVAIGFVIILAAWLIVYTVTTALIDTDLFFQDVLNPFS